MMIDDDFLIDKDRNYVIRGEEMIRLAAVAEKLPWAIGNSIMIIVARCALEKEGTEVNPLAPAPRSAGQ